MPEISTGHDLTLTMSKHRKLIGKTFTFHSRPAECISVNDKTALFKWLDEFGFFAEPIETVVNLGETHVLDEQKE